MKEMPIKYVTVCLMFEMSRREEKKPQGDDAMKVLHQSTSGNPSSSKDVKLCYFCSKSGHIVHFCYKTKNNYQYKNVNTKDDDDYVFAMQYETHLKLMYKWIMHLEASKYMNTSRAIFDTYEVIAPCSVYLDNDSFVEPIETSFIIVEVMVKGNTKMIHRKMYLIWPPFNQFCIGKQIFVECIESAIQPKWMYYEGFAWISDCNKTKKCLR